MKKTTLAASILALCAGTATSLQAEEVPSMPSSTKLITLNEGSSGSLIAALKSAALPGETQPGPHTTTTWQIPSIQCEEGMMELVSPNGKGLMRRAVSTCAAAIGGGEYQYIGGDDAETMIAILKDEGVASEETGGAFSAASWHIANLNCSESMMELIGADGFQVRTISTCSFLAEAPF